MKNTYKVALLAALGLAGVSSAHAQYTGDLLVGIAQTGSANTDVIDLGSFASLTDGETWDLTTSLAAAGITLNSSAVFGVVGYENASTPDQLYVTDSATPANLSNTTHFNAPKADVLTLGDNQGAQVSGNSSGTDWASQTEGTTGLAGALGYNINSSVDSSAQLWTIIANNSAPSEDLTFSFTSIGSDDVLQYGTAAVPEPSTYGLLAGAGLLVVALRRQFGTKNA